MKMIPLKKITKKITKRTIKLHDFNVLAFKIMRSFHRRRHHDYSHLKEEGKYKYMNNMCIKITDFGVLLELHLVFLPFRERERGKKHNLHFSKDHKQTWSYSRN